MKKKKFHCKSEAQRKAIAASYARKAAQAKAAQIEPPLTKPPFKLPLKEGGHRWNIYRVPNWVLNGKQDKNVHGGLVLDEENDNVMLVQVTHSSKKGKRNNLPIRNLVSTDKKQDSDELRDSFLERRLIVSVDTVEGEKGIDIHSLQAQMNDLFFTDEEKRKIIEELSHLSTAEERYKKFQELAKNKNDTH